MSVALILCQTHCHTVCQLVTRSMHTSFWAEVVGPLGHALRIALGAGGSGRKLTFNEWPAIVPHMVRRLATSNNVQGHQLQENVRRRLCHHDVRKSASDVPPVFLIGI